MSLSLTKPTESEISCQSQGRINSIKFKAFIFYIIALNMVGPDADPWDAFRQLSSKDGNIARGHLCIGHASSTFAHSDERLFACVCTRNRVVVEISDAILVASSTHL